MKIIFICGCLEPGKDGVGDYTRRLAGELIRQDISVGIISFNDSFITTQILEHQVSEDINVPCLRLPGVWSGSKRRNHARAWVLQHQPQWLSLQFVPYAFNKKGLPFGLGSQLKKIGGSIKWHIMFHELWIGMEVGASQKDVIIGIIQKYIIKKFNIEIKPKVIHSQTDLYQAQLKSIGLKSEILPLFSNIPIANVLDFERVAIMEEDKLKVELILFGSIHSNAPIEEFAKEVVEYYKNNIKEKKYLTFVGRSGTEKNKWKNIFEDSGFIVKDLGEMNEIDISKALHNSTLGITTTPIYLADKSGTTISMKEHKLPIISVSKKWRPKCGLKINFPEGVMEYKSGNFNKLVELKSIKTNKHDIKEVSREFIAALFSNFD